MTNPDSTQPLGWKSSAALCLKPQVATLFFLGFSAGLPLLLIFSTLSLWLREAGVERSTVTFFSLAALAYSFKFIWAPLVDKLPLLVLTSRLGRRRGWLLFSQFLIVMSILAMASVDPAASDQALVYMALAAIALGFSSATQDICIDAYRIESADASLQAMLSAMYIAGYRVGMLVGGAGGLWLASRFGTEMGQYNYQAWQSAYHWLALFMGVGILTTLVRPEPESVEGPYTHSAIEYFKFFLLFLFAVLVFAATYYWLYVPMAPLYALNESMGFWSILYGFLLGVLRFSFSVLAVALFIIGLRGSPFVDTQLFVRSYLGPVRDFFRVNGLRVGLLLLMVVGLYRMSDIVLGAIANVFYQDIGFTKDQIALVVKTFGLGMTLLGGFLGGVLTRRFGVFSVLLWGAVMATLTNLMFAVFSYVGPSELMLYLVISADNLAGGLAVAAFVAFLSSLTNISFTAVQYALFSSLMTLLPKTLGAYSGTLVDSMGYVQFFVFTTLIGLPILYLVHRCRKFIP